MPRVFISSTGLDLQDYRRAAIAVSNRLGFVAVAMEYFESMGVGANEASRRKLEGSDVYVGIVAHRYGYVEDGYATSVTENEFEYAKDLGLDRLCFIVDGTCPWPPEAIDYRQHDLLERFKEKITTSVVRSTFTVVADFETKLTHSLVEWHHRRTGSDRAAVSDHHERLSFVASAPCPALLIGRESDVNRIKARFLVNTNSTVKRSTILRGWPGVGKTTIASALAHDAEIETRFPDGVVWISLGQDVDGSTALRLSAKALGLQVSSDVSAGDLAARIRDTLNSKRALLVVDDVWSPAQAGLLQLVGPLCATLLTTRFPGVARQLAHSPTDVYTLGVLSTDKSMHLFSELAPTFAQSSPDLARQLAIALEGLPLSVRVAARMVEADASAGFDVTPLLDDLSKGERLLQEVAPTDYYDPLTQSIPTLSILLQRSTSCLEIEDRERFALLGVFAPRPATFDMDAIGAIWRTEDPIPAMRRLIDRGLLEALIGSGRFQIHSLLVAHARSLMTASHN